MRTVIAYTVTYRESRDSRVSHTYRFDVDARRDVATANRDAWAFMRAIDADGGSAGYPAPIFGRG